MSQRPRLGFCLALTLAVLPAPLMAEPWLCSFTVECDPTAGCATGGSSASPPCVNSAAKRPTKPRGSAILSVNPAAKESRSELASARAIKSTITGEAISRPRREKLSAVSELAIKKGNCV